MGLGAIAGMAPSNEGRVSMTVSGAKSGSVEMRDAGFCVATARLGKETMRIFSFAANNATWGLVIGSTTGMPGASTRMIGATHPRGVTARLIDKTSAKRSSEWTRYEALEGTVTFSRADSAHVSGSFSFKGHASWPRTNTGSIRADGTFDAAPGAGCSDAPKARP